MYYDGTLVMPKSYTVIDENEMTYVDGGAFRTSWAATLLDIAGMAICPYLAPVKFMGKQAAKNLVSRYLPSVAGAAAKLARTVLGIGINVTSGKIGKAIFGYGWYFTSVGGIIAISLDAADGQVDGWIGRP